MRAVEAAELLVTHRILPDLGLTSPCRGHSSAAGIGKQHFRLIVSLNTLFLGWVLDQRRSKQQNFNCLIPLVSVRRECPMSEHCPLYVQ